MVRPLCLPISRHVQVPSLPCPTSAPTTAVPTGKRCCKAVDQRLIPRCHNRHASLCCRSRADAGSGHSSSDCIIGSIVETGAWGADTDVADKPAALLKGGSQVILSERKGYAQQLGHLLGISCSYIVVLRWLRLAVLPTSEETGFIDPSMRTNSFSSLPR